MVPLLKFRFTDIDRGKVLSKGPHHRGLTRDPVTAQSKALRSSLELTSAPERKWPLGHRAGFSPGPALTLGDAVLSWQEALLEEALQHRADRWTVHQLQHEEVGLQQSERCYMGGRS